MKPQTELCKRKERRFKTCDQDSLQCKTFVDVKQPVSGTVIDISPGGLRLLCAGEFKVGEPFLTELATDEMKGVFPGIIRRIEPWTDGKCVLGCQLLENIPDELLDELSLEGAINRRRDARVAWAQPALMSCELRSGEDEIKIIDCSHGGLKIFSKSRIPENVMLRIRTEMEGEKIVIEAKAIWQTEQDDGFYAGVSYTTRDVPEAVARILEEKAPKYKFEMPPLRLLAQPIAVAIAVIAVTCLLLVVRA